MQHLPGCGAIMRLFQWQLPLEGSDVHRARRSQLQGQPRNRMAGHPHRVPVFSLLRATGVIDEMRENPHSDAVLGQDAGNANRTAYGCVGASKT